MLTTHRCLQRSKKKLGRVSGAGQLVSSIGCETILIFDSSIFTLQAYKKWDNEEKSDLKDYVLECGDLEETDWNLCAKYMNDKYGKIRTGITFSGPLQRSTQKYRPLRFHCNSLFRCLDSREILLTARPILTWYLPL